MTEEGPSILAALDRNGGSKAVVTKAVELARLTGARLELFLCDAERAFVRQHQYEPRAAAASREACLADSRHYLEQIWSELGVHDVAASLATACESPLYQGIVRAVEHSRPQFVVRGIGAHSGDLSARSPLGANDWELVRACPAPLFLTHGKRWRPRPVIAAAVDLHAGESPELTQAILGAAGRLALRAGGTLEVVNAARAAHGAAPGAPAASGAAAPGAAAADRRAEVERRVELERRAEAAGVEAAHFHVLIGEPSAALPEFAARRGFDLMVLGALTHRKALTALVGTLTARLLESLESDFLLVKPEHRGAFAAAGHASRGAGAGGPQVRSS